MSANKMQSNYDDGNDSDDFMWLYEPGGAVYNDGYVNSFGKSVSQFLLQIK